MLDASLRQTRNVCCTLTLTGLSALLLTGCEAALNLEAVQKQSREAVKRTDFYQAIARNDRVIVLAGNKGTLLVSNDQGNTWQRQTLPTDASLLDLDTCPDGSFIALSFDNQLWHGNASGLQWTAHPLPSQEQMMTAACAPDGSWWAAGSFTTLQGSSDQGASWQETSLDEDAILTNLQFVDHQTVIATGEYGLVLSSTDGGASWENTGYLPDEFYPHASYFRSASEGWAGGLNGFIYHTTDGGESWTQQASASSAPVFGFIPGASGLYAVGDNATVLELRNGAWSALATPNQPLYLRTGLLLNGQQLLVAGGRGLLLNLELPAALAASTD